MTAQSGNSEALDLLSRSERELVVRLLQYQDFAESSLDTSGGESGDSAFLELARLRLRNIVEKRSEALKRARLVIRSGGHGESIEKLELQLNICREAFEICIEHLRRAGAQD